MCPGCWAERWREVRRIGMTPKGRDVGTGGNSWPLMPVCDPKTGRTSDTSSGFSEDRHWYTEKSRPRCFNQSQERSGRRPSNHTPICYEPFWSEWGKRRMLKPQAFGSKIRHMEDSELVWKRQITLEKTGIPLHHKLGGISTPHPHSHPLRQAAWSREQDQVTGVPPNLSHIRAHTGNDDIGVKHRGKQTGRLSRGLPSCPAASSVDSFNIQTPLQLTPVHKTSVRSPTSQAKNLCVSLYI